MTTDRARGSPKLADEEGYETFTVPDDVGGRYSVLTAVGLCPSPRGRDIEAVMAGARDAAESSGTPTWRTIRPPGMPPCGMPVPQGENRGAFGHLRAFVPLLCRVVEATLRRERGRITRIFPASVSFTTDLHSMGNTFRRGFATCLKR